MLLILGIHLSDKIPAAVFESKLRERGYLVNVAGNNTIRLVPPLTITVEDIDGLVAAIDEICAATCVM